MDSHPASSQSSWLAASWLSGVLSCVVCGAMLIAGGRDAVAQNFSTSNLNLGPASVSQGTSLEFGPDGRLYVLQVQGFLDILTIERAGVNQYVVVDAEQINLVKNIPNHNDDGTSFGGNNREATGIAVAGTPTNPIIYATSSDSRIGGPSGDKNLDTNSGVLTRIEWVGADLDDPNGEWVAVDLVRGLPRSEENHATNGLDPVTIGGNDYLIVCSGGHTNAGSPSTNFTWTTEFALSACVLAIDLTMLESMPTLNDGARDYVYDLPTVDDPTRANANGIVDPNAAGYDGVDINDPWGGNDGLNQAKVVAGGPVQMFSPGYRNAYDLVVTEDGRVYVTDNGANGGWGGFPENEGLGGTVTNNYRPGEPGSNNTDVANGDGQVNNKDHLTLVTADIQNYVFGSFYGGHPAPVRANPAGAGLFARGSHSSDPGDLNGNGYTDDWFRTVPFDPNGAGDASDPTRALPADWPPVPLALANPIEGDFRNPGGPNPDGPVDSIVTTWANNSNGIDEYTASNFGGAMQGDLIAGKSGGFLHWVEVLPDGSLDNLNQNWISGLGGNPLGITCNSDSDPFPGTIWVATYNQNIIVLEPQDFVICVMPGDPGYDPLADNDSDGYTNQDEVDNGTDPCNGGSQPGDFDKAAGGALVSDLNDEDDDNDGIDDDVDTLQLGDPVVGGTDAFSLPVLNELFSDNPQLGGYLGLGLTGLMNNGDPNPNWLLWIDDTDGGPNPNDILGGAVGAMTMQMTAGTAVGPANSQEKAFQYGIDVDVQTAGFRVESRMLNFGAGLQLYPFAGPGELGIFMGDGSQSNFIQFVVDHDGVYVLEEVNDSPAVVLSQTIPVGSRPTQSLTFRLDVDSGNGLVTAFYRIDGGAFTSLGSFAAQGAVLGAIQQTTTPVTVGLMGTSNTPGAEVEGTWDYLIVQGRQPGIEFAIENIEEPLGGASSISLDLDDYFSDDDGDGNLTYSVVSSTDPSFLVSILGSGLTIDLPAFDASTTITIRATDASGLFIEQSFTVAVTNALPLFRVNAGGGEIAAIDGSIPWEADSGTNNSQYLADPGSNNTAGFTMVGYDAGVDLTTTPTAIYNTERWDNGAGLPRILYAFPVEPNRNYEVRLYMGNGWSGASGPGGRIFSVEIEGRTFADLTNLDLSASFGHQIGGIVVHEVFVTDGLLEIEYFHGSANNPMLNGIEILGAGGTPPVNPPLQIAAIPNQLSPELENVNLPVIASGGDTPANYQFQAAGLPTGLQIEPTTGLIFGQIAAGAFGASPYSVTITVDDMDADPSDVAMTTFTWQIQDPNQVVWIDKDENENYVPRHECSFVQAGDRFFIFGGREQSTRLDTYDHASDSWTISAPAPKQFNHFQATEYEGLIWIVLAFQNNAFPNELPADFVWVYDPANDAWSQGPAIPNGRKRGGAGLVQYAGKFYCVGGNTIGHNGGYVSWFDEFDPETGEWTALPDAPHARDHFHASVIDGKLYAVGGRLSGGPGGTFAPLIPEVDVYDFATGTWSTLPASSDLPTPRAAPAVGVVAHRLLVMGGEGGGQAYDTVEALDTQTGTWETLAPMNHARHGTQAIVSGGNIFVAGGSPNQGGGNQKNMEVYGVDQITGAASVAGSLTLTTPGELTNGAPVSVSLDHMGGNEGLYVESVTLSGAESSDFQLSPPVTNAFLLPVGSSREIIVEYIGSASSASVTFEVETTGGITSSVTLDVVSTSTMPPVVDLFSATPASIVEGDATTLSWSVSNATSVDIAGVGSGLAPNGSTSVSPTATTAYDLTATGPDGTATAQVVVTVTPAAPTVGSFAATPALIVEGELSTLTWSTSNATSVDIPGVGNGLPANGSADVSPNATTTYDLIANGVGGSASAQTTVVVTPAPPVVDLFGATPDVIIAGASSTLSWSTTNATSVDIAGVGSGLPASGSAAISPLVTTTYDLTANGPGGSAVAQVSVTVTPAPPSITSFSATPQTIDQGDTSTISWSVENASSVDISGLGTGLPSNGSTDVFPATTTTYDLTASGPGGTAMSSVTISVIPAPQIGFPLEMGDVVAGSSWTTVSLDRVYTSPVVVCTPQYGAGVASRVARVRNAGPASFEVRVDRVDGNSAALEPTTVRYLVVEEGVYDDAASGLRMEAVRYTSSVTDENNSWVAENRAYQQSYSNPVVVGQVMTANGDWSVFWSRGTDRTNAPSATALGVGRHVAEDPNPARPVEDIGYVVIEAGSGLIDGVTPWEAGLSSNSILGYDDNPPYSAPMSVVDSPRSAVVSSSTMNGNNGGWPVLYGVDALGASALGLVIDEDLLGDSERIHIAEQVSWFVVGNDITSPPVVDTFVAADSDIVEGATTELSWSVSFATSVDISGVGTGLPSSGTATVSPTETTTYDLVATGALAQTGAQVTITVSPPPTIGLQHGVASGIPTDAWTTISLGRPYASMVVVATPVVLAGDAPVVARVREAGTGAFELRLDRADGQSGAVTGVDVHWFAVEEGVYTLAADGVKLEAVKYTSTVVDSKGSLVGQSRSYQQSYTSPIVVGQVMSDSDAWSVFWARGSSRANPPSSGSLWVGRHVGEDPDDTRASETVGYVVFEAGSFSVGGVSGAASLTSDQIRGVGNNPPFGHPLSGASAQTAVLSAAALDGGDGGWPCLWGPDPLSGGSVSLVIDEDQLGDSERSHTTEQVAVVEFE